MIYSKLKQAHMDSESCELILLWVANKSKITDMCFYCKLILELRFSCLHTISSRGKISTIYCIVT